MSYRNMADLFLDFVLTKRIGYWALHLQSGAEMVPWYFVYDHLNYVRYFLVYIYMMLTVPDTHPSIEEYLAAWDFVAQQQNQYSFSQTCPVGWGCRIHWQHFCNKCPEYDTKQSDGEVPVMWGFWVMRSTTSLPSLPGPLWPRVVAPDRVE